MAQHGSNSVAVKGLTDKRNITLTLLITLAGEFLPIQIIYTEESTTRFQFSIGFYCIPEPKALVQ